MKQHEDPQGWWDGLSRSLLGLSVLASALFFPFACRYDPTVIPAPMPAISNLDNTTTPSASVGQEIEINGQGFLIPPGQIQFAQAANVAVVSPAAAAWSPTFLTTTVPATGSGGAFTIPGNVTVTVVTSVGTSNSVSLSLVPVPAFSASGLKWATTTALPAATRGIGAAAVQATSTSAVLVVSGGNQLPVSGSANQMTVISNTLNADGTLGPSWSTTTALPGTLAYHASVAADPTNSLVTAGTAYIYILGGQVTATDAPGGTPNVWVNSLNTSTGLLSATWNAAPALPVSLVAPAATVYRGFIYVVGGLHSDGTPDGGVYSAQINSDGTLSGWTTSANPFPTTISFTRIFGFGGSLYALGGGTGACTDPTSEVLPSTFSGACYLASAQNGSVGPWTATMSLVQPRQKHALWEAFGQVLIGEGVYSGTVGTGELESSSVQADGTLGAFSVVPAAPGLQSPGTNVYNSASVTSPIVPGGGGPRFLLLGGQALQTPLSGGGGALSANIWHNSAP